MSSTLSGKVERPTDPQSCVELDEAIVWLESLIVEVQQIIHDIQQPHLSEKEYRDMNDDINMLLRRKKSWEARINELGGSLDLLRFKPLSDTGSSLVEDSGYLYFGKARELPEVQELFKRQENREQGLQSLRDVKQLYRRLDANYFGLNDADDAFLLELEQEAEKALKTEWRGTFETE